MLHRNVYSFYVIFTQLELNVFTNIYIFTNKETVINMNKKEVNTVTTMQSGISCDDM